MKTGVINFLNGLRGAQPIIFLTYLITRMAMTIEDLQTYTGLSDQTIRPAVKGMASKGYLYKQTGEHGRQTWIPAGDTFFGKEFTQITEDESQISQNPIKQDSGILVVVDDYTRKNRPTITTTTTTTRQNPIKQDSGKVTAILKTLKKYGVVGKKAKDISECDWVTSEYIQRHIEFAESEGHWDNPVGMAITRMMDGAPEPVKKRNNHKPGKAYSTGMFSEFIFNGEQTENRCIWQAELDEVFTSGPLKGEHKRSPICGNPVTNTSIKWCDEHIPEQT